ncbi:mitochondrial cytochrome c peroxidase [Mytilinidion resinicola]|uniref:Peroxidase n=1 Tax=Mytilinidion resinicola TaxID=574789 RepID=A0A6A6YNW6_9PEZI|nr:mitochondrial cytochrome c peroxidase [Mytilinidion resinicola]KAF2809557.1 mitochondrial cytochrome c peroxidase [Mytilinidion resinicola]
MATAARSLTRSALRSSLATFKTTVTRNSRLAVPRQAFQQSRRGYADSGAPKSGGSGGLIWGIGLAALGGGGYYYYTQNPDLFAKAEEKTKGPFEPKFEDYQKVYKTIAKLLEEKDDYDDGSYGPVLVRLAWHCSGTYDKETGTGGSNGATMRFAPEGDHGANAGLKAARDFLEPVKEQYPWISYSDLWILAGVTAIQEMQGPHIPYRPGRSDRDVSFCTPDGRLPDASKEQKHLRAIFGRMGFNDQEIVALSGAHALGRCHTDRSGYDGPWTFSPTTLTNDYFKLLVEEKWQNKKWNGPKQFEDVSTKTLMMLPTDLALVKDKSFKQYVDKYARDNDAFFKDFSDVVLRLFELGVPFTQGEDARWTFKSSFDEAASS